MENFADIVVAAEQFSVTKYLRDVEEAFSLKQECSDIFAAFRRQALLQITPPLLRDFLGFSSLHFPGDCEILLLQRESHDQHSVDAELPGGHREPNEFPYEFGIFVKLDFITNC
jgi:hypothetical protein